MKEQYVWEKAIVRLYWACKVGKERLTWNVEGEAKEVQMHRSLYEELMEVQISFRHNSAPMTLKYGLSSDRRKIEIKQEGGEWITLLALKNAGRIVQTWYPDAMEAFMQKQLAQIPALCERMKEEWRKEEEQAYQLRQQEQDQEQQTRNRQLAAIGILAL